MIRTPERPMLPLTTCLAVVMIAGCAKTQPTMEPETRASIGAEVPEDPAERTRELGRAAAELTGRARKLPGGSAEQDRQLVADAFEPAARALRILGRDEPGGAFLQQLRIVENSGQQVRSAPGELSVEPTIDAGLRATHNALAGIRDRAFPADAQVGQAMDTLRQRVAELDAVRGPLHRLSVAQAFNAAAATVQQMASSLQQRGAAAMTPATAPAAQ